MKINNVLGHIISIISPSECDSCGNGQAIYPFPICGNCISEIFSQEAPEEIISPLVKKIYSCLGYTPAVRCCVKSFKFHGNLKLKSFFKKIIGSHILSQGLRKEKYDMIMPIPLHRSRKRKRGYNQSEILSGIASSFLGIPVHPGILIKIRNTPPQSGLKKKERQKNLKGSFVVKNKNLTRGKSFLLVDDVMTTGATIEECANTLIKAGASSVSALTLSRVI